MTSSKEIKDEILAVLYKETVDSPFSMWETESILEDVSKRFDEEIEENDLEYAVRTLDEDFLIDLDPAIGNLGTVQLTPVGVDEYGKQHSTFLDQENWHKILKFLQELDKENSGSYWKREKVHQDMKIEDEEIARNIWYLKEKNLIDVSMTTGDPPYTSIQITRRGREAI